MGMAALALLRDKAVNLLSIIQWVLELCVLPLGSPSRAVLNKGLKKGAGVLAHLFHPAQRDNHHRGLAGRTSADTEGQDTNFLLAHLGTCWLMILSQPLCSWSTRGPCHEPRTGLSYFFLLNLILMAWHHRSSLFTSLCRTLLPFSTLKFPLSLLPVSTS